VRHALRSVLVSCLLLVGPRPLCAQRASPTPCFQVLRAEGIPTETLAQVQLPRALVSACEAHLRIPDLTPSATQTLSDAIGARTSALPTWAASANTFTLLHGAMVADAVGAETEVVTTLVAALVRDRIAQLVLESDLALATQMRSPGLAERSLRSSLQAMEASLVALERARALVHTRGHVQVADALVPRIDACRDRVQRARIAAANAVPVCPYAWSTDYERESTRPVSPAPISRVVIAFSSPSEPHGDPLTEIEREAVVEAVRRVLARRYGLEVIDAESTNRILASAQRGEALDQPICAAPLHAWDAIEDARPDAFFAKVDLGCETGCRIIVRLDDSGVSVPSRTPGILVAPVLRAPTSVGSWLAAARALGPIRHRSIGALGGARWHQSARSVEPRSVPVSRPPAATVDSVGGYVTTRYALTDRRLWTTSGRNELTAAAARCDLARLAQGDALLTSVAIDVDGIGRVSRVEVRAADPEVARCIERELSSLVFTCPRNREGGRIVAEICALPR
jgi:hypothetical protein